MKKGFTLVELLLIIALFLIIGVSTSVFYTRFLMQNAVATTSDQLRSALHKAQWYTMMGKNGGNWGVHTDTGQIVLFHGDSYENRTVSLDETLSLYSPVNIIASSDIIFTKRTGSLDNETSFVVSGGNETESIIINRQGIAN
jgi:type II secretory pathway pseudopilin PulG